MSVFSEISVLIKLRTPAKRMKELCTMPLTWSRFWQILACIVQVLNILAPITGEKTKLAISAVVGCIQIVLHDFAGQVNPDGTPASEPYLPPNHK